MNRVNSRAIPGDYLRFGARDDENVFVIRRLGLDVMDFFVDVALHSATQRRIKLSEITDLQGIAERRLAIADFREAAMIATISSASRARGRIRPVLTKPASSTNSSQNSVSSASSS